MNGQEEVIILKKVPSSNPRYYPDNYPCGSSGKHGLDYMREGRYYAFRAMCKDCHAVFKDSLVTNIAPCSQCGKMNFRLVNCKFVEPTHDVEKVVVPFLKIFCRTEYRNINEQPAKWIILSEGGVSEGGMCSCETPAPAKNYSCYTCGKPMLEEPS